MKAGSRVGLKLQSDQTLLIVPKDEIAPETALETTFSIRAEDKPQAVTREFVSRYLAGYDIVQVNFEVGTSKHRNTLKDTIRRKLMGVEITDESMADLTAQCLLGYKELPVDRALSRMSLLASAMHKDATNAFLAWDHSLAHDVQLRDDEVDRFYFFIVRQLKRAIINRSMIDSAGLQRPSDILGYRLIVKSVERVADHSARIASMALLMEGPPESRTAKEIQEMSMASQTIFDDALKSLYQQSAKLAHETIERTSQVVEFEEKIIGRLSGQKLTGGTTAQLRIVLESIRRCAEYGSDVAEIVLNLLVDKEISH